jgi:6-phosphogluconolactonase (cycloisomerase 2 family)
MRSTVRIFSALLLLLLAVATAGRARAAVLEFVDAQRENVDGVTGLAGVLAVVVSPDGRYVYAAGGNDDAIAVFGRDAATGALDERQVVKNGVGGIQGLAFPTALALSPDGTHLYVAGTHDDAVVAFARDTTSGSLTFIEAQIDGAAGVEGLRNSSAVVVSPDGSHVYVAGQHDDAIAVFRRNAVTGWLAFVEVQRDGVNGVKGIAGPLGLAISPDGKNVYVASGNVSALGAFSRDATTGRLQQIDLEQEGGTAVGLRGIHGVAVSPDGASVYGVGQADSAVAVFRRNKSTGTLKFDDAAVQGVDGVEGLGGALRAAISPDGTNLFVASTIDNVVAAFDRNPDSGALTFLEKQKGGPGDWLAFARGVAVSPDGKNVYVAGASSNALNVFRVTGD